jgi:indolepyruvate ferredoxin oxidoreductase, beta subunit
LDRLNILIAGVGGQGVVLAGDILADVALAAGMDVKKTDTLGMAQRGGGVVTHLRMGPEVASPLIGESEADMLISFEKLEAARWASYLRVGATVIINDLALPPLGVSRGEDSYPADDEISHIFSHRNTEAMFIDGSHHAGDLGNPKVLNVLMLGSLSMLMPFDPGMWENAIKLHLPEKLRPVNLAAFSRGRRAMMELLAEMPGATGHSHGGDDGCGCSH